MKLKNLLQRHRRCFGAVLAATIAIGIYPGLGLGGATNAATSQPINVAIDNATPRSPQQLTPYRGYLSAHKTIDNPMLIMGGPLTTKITQESGDAFAALPDQRRLDANVFGTPDYPRAFAGTPIVNGLPLNERAEEKGAYTFAEPLSPFGDRHIVMRNGVLSVTLVDATATDAATSKDQAKMEASWQDQEGHTYTVRCCEKLLTAGIEFPTFGGVVTNHILQGSSRIGSAMMPTVFAYAAFWGFGEVLKNGVVIDKGRLIQGMLSEYVRTTGYRLGFDEEVTPARRQFHIMVLPVRPKLKQGVFESSPVITGFRLNGGEELPFWHVAFETLEITEERD